MVVHVVYQKCGVFGSLQLAEDTFREHTRKLVEENISAALGKLKSQTRTAYVYDDQILEKNPIIYAQSF